MDKLTANWHKAIIALAENKLSRALSSDERLFIESRLSYVALDAIEDSVNEFSGNKLESYLNSEL